MKFREMKMMLHEITSQQNFSQNQNRDSNTNLASTVVDRRLIRAVNADYNKVVRAIQQLNRNPNPKYLPPDLRTHYNAYMSAVMGAAQKLARTGGGSRYFKEKYELESLSENFDPPMIINLKRKAIRVFPDGKKVALYTSDSLGLSFTIPYDSKSGQLDNPTMSSEETLYEQIEQIFEMPQASVRMIKPHEAVKLLDVYNRLNPQNQEKMRLHLKTDKINDVLKFVAKHGSLSKQSQETKSSRRVPK